MPGGLKKKKKPSIATKPSNAKTNRQGYNKVKPQKASK